MESRGFVAGLIAQCVRHPLVVRTLKGLQVGRIAASTVLALVVDLKTLRPFGPA